MAASSGMPALKWMAELGLVLALFKKKKKGRKEKKGCQKSSTQTDRQTGDTLSSLPRSNGRTSCMSQGYENRLTAFPWKSHSVSCSSAGMPAPKNHFPPDANLNKLPLLESPSNWDIQRSSVCPAPSERETPAAILPGICPGSAPFRNQTFLFCFDSKMLLVTATAERRHR